MVAGTLDPPDSPAGVRTPRDPDHEEVSTIVRTRQLLVLIAFTAIACTPSPNSSPRSPAPTSTPKPSTPRTVETTRSPAELASERAVDAYLGMWRNMATAARTSDPRSPLLSVHATGDALLTISRGLYADGQNGLVTRGEPKNHPRVSMIEPSDRPTKVGIVDCGDSTHWLKYRADTGRLADDGPGGRRAITATVDRQADGAWRVSGFVIEGVGSC